MSLDWPEERYVRVYTRKTPEWMALTWQAKALNALLLMECDRAGIIAVPMGSRRIRMVAAATGMPPEIVEVGLADLLDDGRVVETEVGYVWPNFIAAQESVASPKKRMKEYRARKRELRAAAALEGVTKRNAPETNRIQTVTPCRAVPTSLREVDGRAAVAAPASRTAVAAVLNQDSKPEFQTTTPQPPVELGAGEAQFMRAWNDLRSERGRAAETPTLLELQGIACILDAADRKDPERAQDAVVRVIANFLDDKTFRRRTLSVFVKPSVWEVRLDDAFAELVLDAQELEQQRTKRFRL